MATKLFIAGMAATAGCAATLLEQQPESIEALPVRIRARWEELRRQTQELSTELCTLALKKD